MKKIAKFSIIMLLMIIGLKVNVYAKPNCNVNIQINKTEINKNEEFTVEVKISNIQSERGIIALEGILEYDKESITLIKMEGQNDWSTPIKDLSYNESNGKLVIDKKGLAKGDETILKLVFKANETSKKNNIIILKDITIADGILPSTVVNTYKYITVKEGTENPIPNPPVDQKPDPKPEPDKNTNKVSNDTNISNKDNIVGGKLPQTGSNNIILITSIVIFMTIGIVMYVKIRNVDRKSLIK